MEEAEEGRKAAEEAEQAVPAAQGLCIAAAPLQGLSIAVAAVQVLSIAAAAMMMMRCLFLFFFFFQKRVPCIPGTFVQPPERRAPRTTWESAPTKRNARSLCAHASVKLEACPANPKRSTRHCMK